MPVAVVASWWLPSPRSCPSLAAPALWAATPAARSPASPPAAQVKKRGDDRKYLARVLSIGIECDIALLAVDDPGFWEGVEPLQFGPLPRLQDSVAVVGYPVGGDTISITAGVVSRIEVGARRGALHTLPPPPTSPAPHPGPAKPPGGARRPLPARAGLARSLSGRPP
jgi:hypothetical protein